MSDAPQTTSPETESDRRELRAIVARLALMVADTAAGRPIDPEGAYELASRAEKLMGRP